MTADRTEILNDPEQFEQYCARVEGQLSSQPPRRYDGESGRVGELENGGRGEGAIFNSADRFEEYCAQVAERLRPQWEQRLELMRRAGERLRSLKNVAQAVRDSRLESELSEHLALAAAQLEALEALSGLLRPEQHAA